MTDSMRQEELNVENTQPNDLGEPRRPDPGAVAGNKDSIQLGKVAADGLYQRLYSIVLAVHAAQTCLDTQPHRLNEILQLIHDQAEASLADLVRLSELR